MLHPVRIYSIILILIMMAWPAMVYADSPTANHGVAQNFAVARNTAQEALLAAAQRATTLPDGVEWLEGLFTCLTPVDAAAPCAVPWSTPAIANAAPAHWQVLPSRQDTNRGDAQGDPRWRVIIQNGHIYVYGIVHAAEMAAIRKITRHTPTIALCPHNPQSTGDHCLPPLQYATPEGSKTALPLPQDRATLPLPPHGQDAGMVVSIIRMIP